MVAHLTYYVTVYSSNIECFDNELDCLKYAPLEEMLNFINEAKEEYAGDIDHLLIRTIRDGEIIDSEQIK